MYSDWLPLAGLIILSGIFSGSETALVSISKSKVTELVADKRPNSRVLEKLKRDPHKLLITVLIGNNVVNIGASAYAAILFTEVFGSSGVGIATGIMTFLILIFGEIMPKAFAHEHSVTLSLLMARPVYLLQIILYPAVLFFELIVTVASKLMGANKSHSVTEGELVAMLKIGTQEGSIEKQEREFIENVLEFNDTNVEDVMTPRVKIEALNEDMTLKEAVDFVIKHSHSRLPIYRDSIDNIVGILSIKDLLGYYYNSSKSKLIKNLDILLPFEVPLSKKTDKLFREFQKKHVHIAVVIDEHGGTAGIVTLEDLLEEIVGEIIDESDVHKSNIEILNKNTIIVSGSTEVEYINDFFKMKFGSNDHDTVNTLITEHLHRFPREGETVKFPRANALILKMNGNIIANVKISRLKLEKNS